MKILKLFIVFCLFLVFGTSKSRADIVCMDGSNGGIPNGHVVISLTQWGLCKISIGFNNALITAKPSEINITNICADYSYPQGFIVVKNYDGKRQCSPIIAGDVAGSGSHSQMYSIKKPNPGGDVMCKVSKLPPGFTKGNEARLDACGPYANNAWNIYDAQYVNSRPLMPTNIRTNNINGQIVFTWDDPSTIPREVWKYEIQIYRDGQQIAKTEQFAIETRKYTINNAVYGHYTFNIRSVKNVNGKLLYSDYASTEIIAGVSIPVPNDLTYNLYGSQIRLYWNMPTNILDSDFDNFEVTAMKNGKIILNGIAYNYERMWILNDVEDGNYVFQVRAVKVINNYKYYSAAVTLEMSINPPPAPTAFSAISLGDDIVLNWAYIGQAEGFVIRYRESSSSQWNILAYPLTITARSYTVKNMFRNTYEFTVEAIKNGRFSEKVYAQIAHEKPHSPLTEYLPSNLNAQLTSEYEPNVLLTWDLPAMKGDQISVIWYLNRVEWKEIILPANSTSHAAKLPTDGGYDYTFEIRIIKNGYYSDIVSQSIRLPNYRSQIELNMYEGGYQWFPVPNDLTQATISGSIEHKRFSIAMAGEEVYAIEDYNEEPGFTFPLISGDKMELFSDVTMGGFVGELILTKGPSLGEIPYFNAQPDGNGNIALSWAAPSAPVNEYVVYINGSWHWEILAKYPADQTSAILETNRGGINKLRFVARNDMAYSEAIYAEIDLSSVSEPEPESELLDMGDNTFYLEFETSVYLRIPEGCSYIHITPDGNQYGFSYYINGEIVDGDQDISVIPGDRITIVNKYRMGEDYVIVSCF